MSVWLIIRSFALRATCLAVAGGQPIRLSAQSIVSGYLTKGRRCQAGIDKAKRVLTGGSIVLTHNLLLRNGIDGANWGMDQCEIAGWLPF